jgi:phosphoglycolate phosphatase
MNKAILFDLDGTLLNTSEGILDSVRYTLSVLSLPDLSDEILLKFVGPPIQHSLKQYAGLNNEQAQYGTNIFREYYKSKALFKACLYPGIKEVLISLREMGVHVGVATYKREDYAIELLQHFGIAEICHVIHGADNENKLTKSDIVELCIKELGQDRNDVILVGDTKHDAKGANDAHVGFIAVTWGFGYKDVNESIEYPCKAVVSTTNELKSVIECIVENPSE